MIQVYSLVLVISIACTYFNDRETKVGVYIRAKVVVRDYFYGKLLAMFLTTFIVFTTLFLLETIPNYICFPIGTAHDHSNALYYNFVEIEN